MSLEILFVISCVINLLLALECARVQAQRQRALRIARSLIVTVQIIKNNLRTITIAQVDELVSMNPETRAEIEDLTP